MSAPCGCAVYGYKDADEYCILWREGTVSATRTEHRCVECDEVIPAGSRCCYAASLYDGKWGTMYRCLSCATLAEYVAETKKACPLWGHLGDSAFEAGVSFSVYRTTGRFSLYESDEEESA